MSTPRSRGRPTDNAVDGTQVSVLRLSLPRVPFFREGANVFFTGTEEIQKVHAHVPASLTNTQQHQVFFDASLGERPFDDVSQLRKRF